MTHSIIYKVSSHCPFDYCIPHASYVSLSSPDTQCQFKRSGTLCGHCKVDFSTVFGTSQCKQCSNIYLLIVIPIIIADLVLVIALFIFNITINNGIINTFIFYITIININYSYSVFFSQNAIWWCVYILISLSNVDLENKTCFCDGMDDYAKMWLQLAFLIYLFLIAHLLITESHYSCRIYTKPDSTQGTPGTCNTATVVLHQNIINSVLCPVLLLHHSFSPWKSCKVHLVG